MKRIRDVNGRQKTKDVTLLEVLSDWTAVGHLIGAGEGGAERPDLKWAESVLSVECERVQTGRSAIARWSAERERL